MKLCNIEVMKVYIAGPYTYPEPIVNTHEAVQTANELLDLGYVPFVPHLNAFWHYLTPRTEQDWLDWDLEWLKSCDCIVRLPGESKGSDHEVKMAKKWGIPLMTLEELRTLKSRIKGGDNDDKLPRDEEGRK